MLQYIMVIMAVFPESCTANKRQSWALGQWWRQKCS